MSFLNKLKILSIVFLNYLFFFPGLVLHELTHALMAKITYSRITDISLFPSITFREDGYSVTYGYVSSQPKIKVMLIFIGLAPLLLWVIPPLFLYSCHILVLSHGSFALHTNEITFLNMSFFAYIMSQVFWAGFPSRQDMKIAFLGLFSFSGIVIVLISSLLIWITL